MVRNVVYTPDRFTRWILASIAALLAIVAVELWVASPPDAVCHAQIPDSGRQRQDMLAEARQTNERLSEILDVLKKGTVKVEFVATDKQKRDELCARCRKGA